MLYHVYDLHRAVLSPLHLTANALRQVWNHPLHPLSYTRMGRAVAAGAELLERATTRYAKPEFGLHHTTIDGQGPFPAHIRGLPMILLVDEQGRVVHLEYVEIKSLDQLVTLVNDNLGTSL